MGIRRFYHFLTMPRNKDKALQSFELHDKYLVIDGSELMYKLFCDENHYGRGNYLEYRENIKAFFKSLQDCNVKPVVVNHGFKFEYESDVYIERRNEKIRSLFPVSRKQNSDVAFKGYFCERVFKETVIELGVPFFVAGNNTDNNLAAISRILKAPVLANDTIFCAYHLDAGWLPPKDFDWKKVGQKKGSHFLPAKLYQINRFAKEFGVRPNVLSFMGIVFNKRKYDKYQSLRKEASSTMGRPFDRPFNVQTFLDWNSRLRYSNDQFTNKLLNSLPRDTDIAEERELINQQINDFEFPRLNQDLLELIERLQDEDLGCLLTSDMSNFKDEEEEKEPIQRQDLLKKAYAGEFPYWALRLLILHDRNEELNHFLSLVMSDPKHFATSPQKAGAFLRKWSYKILLRDTDETTVTVYDRDFLNYRNETISFEPYQDNEGLFSPDLSNEVIALKRRNFILDLLIEDNDEAESYVQNINDLSDDMKLTLAVTKSWIQTTYPSFDMQQAMVILLTLMQLKEESNRMRHEDDKVMKVVTIIERKAKDISMPVDTQVLQCSSEWEVIMNEAIDLNQILMLPLPEPILGRFFSGSLLENLFTLLSNEESQLLHLLRSKLNSYQNCYERVSAYLLVQEFV